MKYVVLLLVCIAIVGCSAKSSNDVQVIDQDVLYRLTCYLPSGKPYFNQEGRIVSIGIETRRGKRSAERFVTTNGETYAAMSFHNHSCLWLVVSD